MFIWISFNCTLLHSASYSSRKDYFYKVHDRETGVTDVGQEDMLYAMLSVGLLKCRRVFLCFFNHQFDSGETFRGCWVPVELVHILNIFKPTAGNQKYCTSCCKTKCLGWGRDMIFPKSIYYLNENCLIKWFPSCHL